MAKVTFIVTGLDEVLEQLDRFSTLLKDGPGIQVMRETGQAALEDVDARFDTGGYGTWVPLSPLTIAAKGGRTEILIDTSNMRKSVGIGELETSRVTVTVPTGGKDNDPRIPGYHQRGGGRLPQRKIVEDTPQLREKLTAVIHPWSRSWIDG